MLHQKLNGLETDRDLLKEQPCLYKALVEVKGFSACKVLLLIAMPLCVRMDVAVILLVTCWLSMIAQV